MYGAWKKNNRLVTIELETGEETKGRDRGLFLESKKKCEGDIQMRPFLRMKAALSTQKKAREYM